MLLTRKHDGFDGINNGFYVSFSTPAFISKPNVQAHWSLLRSFFKMTKFGRTSKKSLIKFGQFLSSLIFSALKLENLTAGRPETEYILNRNVLRHDHFWTKLEGQLRPLMDDGMINELRFTNVSQIYWFLCN